MNVYFYIMIGRDCQQDIVALRKKNTICGKLFDLVNHYKLSPGWIKVIK